MTNQPQIDFKAAAQAITAFGDAIKAAFYPTGALTALINDNPDRAQQLLAGLPDDRLATVERAATQLAYRAADIRQQRQAANEATSDDEPMRG